MRIFRAFFFAVTFLIVTLWWNSVASDVTVDPYGFAVAIEEGEETNVELVLSNSGENDVEFSISYRMIDDDDDQREGPQRDDPGDIIREYDTPYEYIFGLAWDYDNFWTWGADFQNRHCYAINPENGEVVVDFQMDDGFRIRSMFYLDGILYGADYTGGGNGRIRCHDTEGNLIESLMSPFGLGNAYIATDGEHIFFNRMTDQQGLIHIYNLDDLDGDEVATIDFRAAFDGNFDGRAAAFEWVHEHPDGQLWISSIDAGHFYQFSVDEDWNCEFEQDFPTGAGGTLGIAHDGENLWSGRWSWFVIDDGVREFHMLTFNPETGVIQGEDSETVEIHILAEGAEAGVYNVLIGIELTEPEEDRDDLAQALIEISAVISLESPTAGLSGVVTDAATDETIEGVTVETDLYIITRFTDEDGAYAFTDLPPGNYEFTFETQDYLPLTREVELVEEDVELNVTLLHSECNLSVEGIIADLAPDTDTEVDFSISNDGNGALTYTSDRRLLGDANADPWGWRASFNVGETVDDNYLYGVVFINDHYYVSGENDGEPSIYVLDREGELVETIAQVGEDDDGVRDLAWDGELIWGTEQSIVLGFTPAGEPVTSFEGPYRPITAIAWDPDRELLWIASTTRGINGVNTDGEEIAELDRHDLRIYGLAYWSDNPDGFPLYVFNKERDTNRQTVHKINPDNDEFEFVAYLDPENGGNPVGAYITNQYDIYSWVFIDISSASRNAGGDRIDIWQIDARKDWMQIEPSGAGFIEAGGEQGFVLTLDATGLPPAPFEGEIVFLHDGVGSETHLPVTLNVVEGRVPTERTLELGLGWSMVSVNLQPDERDVTVLTRPLVEEDLLEMMKDGFGHFYNPEFGFNNIPGWFVEQGYMMKVTDDCELTLEGMSVLAEEPIDLQEGWQIVSYYPRRPVEAILALSGIVDQLLIAKDGDGQFYIPEFGFSNMGNLREGQGYQLKMAADDRLVYTLGEGALATISPSRSGRADIPACPGRVRRHFGTVAPTGKNMSLLVIAGTPPFNSPPAEQGGMVRNSKQRGIQINSPTSMRGGSKGGAELGVFTSDGMLVGSGVFDDEGRCGVAVWSDDPTTEESDGLREGESFELRLWQADEEFVLETQDVKILRGNQSVFHADDLVIVEIFTQTGNPCEFSLSQAYPNPFNGTTSLSYSLPERAQVNLMIYNLSGRLVETLHEGFQSRGIHQSVWTADGIPSGVYVCRLESNNEMRFVKVALIR